MGIKNLYRPGSFGLSIEIFPPKTADGDGPLFENLERLVKYRPGFISCTYGAGGSTQARTIELCTQIQSRFNVTATSHLTCVGSTRDELRAWLHSAAGRGITNIMALRGDAPVGQTEFKQVAGGLKYAAELVKLIRAELADTGIGVAGYPEKHPEAPSLEADMENLRCKVAEGADAVFTQLFYDNASFYRFRDECTRKGIDVPVIPGIMPITEFARIKRITSMCQAVFPPALASRLEAVQDDKQAQFEIGVDYAIQQCRELIDAGVPGMHFYVLNKSQACEMILDALNYSPAANA